MDVTELAQTLIRLQLSQVEAGNLLGVSGRTVRRWFDGEAIPGPAQQALRAWVRLHERRLPWRPDSEAIAASAQGQLSLYQEHAIGLDQALARVEARGGPAAPWEVDIQKSEATLGPIEVSFYRQPNGGFSLGTYTRRDMAPDIHRDSNLIDDATYCIAQALLDGPVTLVTHDKPWRAGTVHQNLRNFPSREEALRAACAGMKAGEFFDHFIMRQANEGDVVIDKFEVKRECNRRVAVKESLEAISEYVREFSHIFLRNGARMQNAAERAATQQHIEDVGNEIRQIAGRAESGSIAYLEFDEALGRLQKLGFYPKTELVSAAAKAFFT